ncbi:hypothetical protein ATANTOWER_029977 [Ataeniobius toweri]|uniref:Uncharacterized protein n=1 Tax=Ataeniobius toweri TaxID=208326 RepID=A0ABU7B923_9TELE|nr:hypothetical protein [Ataeniobius toweri]
MFSILDQAALRTLRGVNKLEIVVKIRLQPLVASHRSFISRSVAHSGGHSWKRAPLRREASPDFSLQQRIEMWCLRRWSSQ